MTDEEHGDGADEYDGHVGLAGLGRGEELPLHRGLGATREVGDRLVARAARRRLVHARALVAAKFRENCFNL